MSSTPSNTVLSATTCPFKRDNQAATCVQLPANHPHLASEGEDKQMNENGQLAAALRKGTHEIHRSAETSVFAKKFLKGHITKEEYGQYITSLYFVYRMMETLLAKHYDHPAIKPIHFPNELERTHALLDDLAFYYGQERVEYLTDATTMTPVVRKYVSALERACNEDPSLLVAHSYTRYLADLSGGQILSKRFRKHVLLLDREDSAANPEPGLFYYHFNNIEPVMFKNMFRERLDTIELSVNQRDAIVEEAVHAFQLNIELFDEVHKMSQLGKLACTLGHSAASGSQGPLAIYIPMRTLAFSLVAFAISLRVGWQCWSVSWRK